MPWMKNSIGTLRIEVKGTLELLSLGSWKMMAVSAKTWKQLLGHSLDLWVLLVSVVSAW